MTRVFDVLDALPLDAVIGACALLLVALAVSDRFFVRRNET